MMATRQEGLKQIVSSLPFVKTHAIEIADIGEGTCLARMALQPEFSTPPNLFPAAMVGMLGDVAGITACISKLEPRLVCSTLDFTIKMTSVADGEMLEAEGEVLSAGKAVATGQSKIYSIKGNERKLCAIVVVTGRVTSLR